MKPLIAFLLSLSLAVSAAQAQTTPPSTNGDAPPQSQGQTGWIQQNSGTTAPLGEVVFWGNDTGWAASSVTLHTTNGGATCQRLDNIQHNPLYVMDDTTLFGSDDHGTIFLSVDRGNTWKSASSGLTRGPSLITFVNRNTGFALDKLGFISRTIDGGNTWDPEQEIGNGLNAISFSDAKHGFIVGDDIGTSAQINRTTDGGVSWQDVPNQIRPTLRAVHAFSDSEAIVAGGGIIAQTTNRGLTWDTLKFDQSLAFFGMSFLDRQRGTIVGGPGLIFSTSDGGRTWIPQHSPVAVSLYSVQLVNDSVGAIAGEAGTILRTANGGKDWVADSRPPASLDVHTYPEPFNAQVILSYALPVAQRVTIRIFDTAGNTVVTLLENVTQSAGDHSLPFNDTQYPAGVYYYTLSSDLYTTTGKLTLVK
jgi:photosystem II stability/assembly factor-like uncharacterized protein